ncbi:Trk system potassium transporter TrkA [Carboxylicivirga linearis]|uniref:Trk system potassium uptake protein TrkA n=1 Tax=Carboxylicivirga linearis TaxID=1628157 RepID=A0ABS5JVS1_9BACT|nr:Trk system potassium transporter TrkA [Carboxylicivirga linearis]MBS2098923.1 Trk system potassium transporter TrkA [Carboxylicivirga linearis]
MRIFIAGAGEVGTHLAKMFCNANHDVILMDEDEEKLKQVDSHFDLMTIVGTISSIEDLREANVKSCDLFIAVPPYQDMSILSCILAKQLGAKTTVARVNNHEYLMEENKLFFKKLGIDELIYPEQLGAKEVRASLKQVGTRQMFEFTGSKLVMFALKVRDNALIVGKTLAEISAMYEKQEYNVVAILRSGETIIPRGQDVLRHNDLVYVITTKSAVKQVMVDAGKKQFEIKNVMILGGSRIGKKVAEGLEGKYNIKLIEIDKERAIRLADQLSNTLVINGDGRNLELLKDEGIKKMDAFVAVTGNSEVNILACQLAKKMGVPKTVAEVENIDYIDLAENIGIGTLINKKLIAASHIYRYTLRANVSHVRCLTATDAEVLELTAQPGSKITKGPLRKLGLPKDVNIGGIIRGESAIIATGDTVIEPNDKVVMFAMPSGIPKVEKMFS